MIYSRTMTRPITMQSLNHTATRYHRNIMLPMDSVSDWADKWPRLTTAGCRQKTSLSPTFPAVRHRSVCHLSAEAEIARSKASAGVLVIDDCLAFSLSSLRSFPYLNVAVVGGRCRGRCHHKTESSGHRNNCDRVLNLFTWCLSVTFRCVRLCERVRTLS